MGLAAVSLALVTILIGTLVLADLGSRPGTRRFVGVHVFVALVGSTVLAVAAFASSPAIAAIGVGVLSVAVGLGVLTWRRTTSADPAAKSVSSGILIAHGAGAALTIVFAVLAAAR